MCLLASWRGCQSYGVSWLGNFRQFLYYWPVIRDRSDSSKTTKRFNLTVFFFAYSQKKKIKKIYTYIHTYIPTHTRTPWKVSLSFFSPEKLTPLKTLHIEKWWNLLITCFLHFNLFKLVVEWGQLYHGFSLKLMTLVYARAPHYSVYRKSHSRCRRTRLSYMHVESLFHGCPSCNVSISWITCL